MRESINENIIQLLDKQLRNEALSNEELLEIKHWVELSENNRQLYNELTDKQSLEAALREFGEPDTEASLRKMRRELFGEVTEEAVPVRKMNSKKWLVAAAVAGGIVLAGVFLLNTANEKTTGTTVAKQDTPKAFTNQIPPGGDFARLTLSNGSTIILDSNQRGVLAIEESAILHGEKLLINLAIANKNTAGEVSYNTLSTPRGFFNHAAQEMILPDKSHVWLYPSSSIKFPDAFAGDERVVEVSGEAYFDVTKDATKPFIVKAKDADIKVLGTSFNVTAYDDDNTIIASLIEGSIQFSHKNNKKTLTPGMEAVVTGQSGIKINKVTKSDIEDRQKGIYKFDAATLQTVMNQVKRLYKVNVTFKEGTFPDDLVVTLDGTKQLKDELDKLNSLGTFTCALSVDKTTITVSPNKTEPHP